MSSSSKKNTDSLAQLTTPNSTISKGKSLFNAAHLQCITPQESIKALSRPLHFSSVLGSSVTISPETPRGLQRPGAPPSPPPSPSPSPAQFCVLVGEGGVRVDDVVKFFVKDNDNDNDNDNANPVQVRMSTRIPALADLGELVVSARNSLGLLDSPSSGSIHRYCSKHLSATTNAPENNTKNLVSLLVTVLSAVSRASESASRDAATELRATKLRAEDDVRARMEAVKTDKVSFATIHFISYSNYLHTTTHFLTVSISRKGKGATESNCYNEEGRKNSRRSNRPPEKPNCELGGQSKAGEKRQRSNFN